MKTVRRFFMGARSAFFALTVLILYKAGLLLEPVLPYFEYNVLFRLKSWLKDVEYRELCSYIFETNARRISKKSKIKICFMLAGFYRWPGDRLYNLFLEDPKYEVYVCAFDPERPEIDALTRRYFAEKRIPIYSYESNKLWRDADLFIGDTSFGKRFYKNCDLYSRRLSSLSIRVPYTFWHAREIDKLISGSGMEALWKIYTPSILHKKSGIKENVMGDKIMVYSGYPKLDALYQKAKTNPWAFAPDKAKKILYTPGLVIKNFGTFDLNHSFMYNLAKKRTDVSWVIRLHPHMPDKLNGIMSKKEYKRYLNLWENLPNARLDEGDDYFDLFLTSDAMITDSISFVSGYQYVKKPLLILERYERGGLNLYGKRLMSVQTAVKGDDFNGIEAFVDSVVNGQNNISKSRELFFDKYLDYKKINGLLSSDFIKQDIDSSL